MNCKAPALALVATVLASCATSVNQQGTLAELNGVDADLDEIYLEDSLERAAQSYRRYLQETPESARTPEAMRRLADLQIEQAYGVMGSGDMVEMRVPEAGTRSSEVLATSEGQRAAEPSESDVEFENRAVTLRAIAATTRGSVKIAGSVGDQIASRIRAVVAVK